MTLTESLLIVIIILCIFCTILYDKSKFIYVVCTGIVITGVCLSACLNTYGASTKSGSYIGAGSGKEYEARWIDIDVDAIRSKIIAAGGKLYHEPKLYRRYVYPLSGNAAGYARVRLEYDDAGSVVTLTTKTYADKNFPVENEVTVEDDFDTARKFIESLNMKPKAYHETIREKYTGIDGCNEIAIDTIPGLNPYVEIDCTSETRMKELAAKMDLDMTDAKFGAYAGVFADEYGIDAKWFNDELDLLTFDTVAEKLGEKVVKNKDKFDTIVEKYKDKKIEL